MDEVSSALTGLTSLFGMLGAFYARKRWNPAAKITKANNGGLRLEIGYTYLVQPQTSNI